MNHSQQYTQLWATSKHLSEAYWSQYNQLIGPLKFAFDERDHDGDTGSEQSSADCPSQDTQVGTDNEDDEKQEQELEEQVNQEYEEFIRITRKHQLEREFLKKERATKEPQVEEYYKDISQVNTLVEDNIVEVPQRNKVSRSKLEERKLIDRYGSREEYDRIRSMEMCIDDHFKSKYQQLQPTFWPVIPLNPRPYFNKS